MHDALLNQDRVNVCLLFIKEQSLVKLFAS